MRRSASASGQQSRRAILGHVEVVVTEPGGLGQAQLDEAEVLVKHAFGGGFRSHDWLHGVDGVHVTVTEDGQLLAHASVVPRTLRHRSDVLDTGYVEAVAVRRDQQGRGLGGLVMDAAETVIRTRYDIGAMNAIRSAEGFYTRRGWRLWQGPTGAAGFDGVIDTRDPADLILLLPVSPASHPLDESLPLICDWRAGHLW